MHSSMLCKFGLFFFSQQQRQKEESERDKRESERETGRQRKTKRVGERERHTHTQKKEQHAGVRASQKGKKRCQHGATKDYETNSGKHYNLTCVVLKNTSSHSTQGLQVSKPGSSKHRFGKVFPRQFRCSLWSCMPLKVASRTQMEEPVFCSKTNPRVPNVV